MEQSGITSATVLYKFFRNILKYENTVSLVNTRRDGNGFNKVLMGRILDEDKKQKIDIMITSDHGSSDNKAFKTLLEHNIETILTDHHEIPKDNYPSSAKFVINPMREDNLYYEKISGCYVAYLLCLAIYRKIHKGVDTIAPLYTLLPYVGFSCVVDMMPMTSPINRAMTVTGLREVLASKDKNLDLVINKLNLTRGLFSKNIGWNIGPYVNSGNRCGTEEAVFQSLIKENSTKDLAYALNENRTRKRGQNITREEAINRVLEEYHNVDNIFAITTIIESKYGISGPVASSISEVYDRPTIVFKEIPNSNELIGSGRSKLDVNILQVLLDIQEQHPNIIKKAAGHKGACGITLYKDKFKEFRELLNETTKKALNGKIPKSYLDIARTVNVKDINLSLALEVESIGPYGNKWSEPVFLSFVKYKSSFPIGTNRIINFERNKKSNLSGFLPNAEMISNWKDIKEGDTIMIAFKISLNYKKGQYGFDIGLEKFIPMSLIESQIKG